MMKKIILTLAAMLIFFSCGLFNTVDLGKLTIGMSKADVANLIGPPQRVLAVNRTNNGYQEVLEYKTYRDEVYALEFWNDYLTGYEFLYEEVTYVPAPAPPVIWPNYGQPLIPNYRPNKPSKPNAPARPTEKPNTSNRPETNNNRPGTNTGSERPTNNTRPERPSSSTQTETGGRENTTRSTETTRTRSSESGTRTNTRTSEDTNTNTTRERSSDSGGRTNSSR